MTVDWAKVAEECLKLLGGLTVGVILGWLARKYDVFHRKDWDTKKAHYDLFKEAQRDRIETVGEMIVIVQRMHDGMRRYLLYKGMEPDEDADKVRFETRRNLMLEEIKEELDLATKELKGLSVQYGGIPESVDVLGNMPFDMVISVVTMDVWAISHEIDDTDLATQKLNMKHMLDQLEQGLVALMESEKQILALAKPEDTLQIFRSNSLRPGKLSGLGESIRKPSVAEPSESTLDQALSQETPEPSVDTPVQLSQNP